MKIACIGGGPAGLYLGILVKRVAPQHDVVVYERNRPNDTFGFGVVFSDATLGHLAAADPESHRAIVAQFARWDDIEIQIDDQQLRSTGHGFCGLERRVLLDILQRRAREVGVDVRFEHEVKRHSDVTADLIVGCDGVASGVRDALASEFKPAIDNRPNRFVWLGCTVPYAAFTFIFKRTKFGLFRVHAYPFTRDQSTFIVECRDETWRAAKLDVDGGVNDDHTIAVLSEVFRDELAGHRLIKNRSIWRNFPTVRCGRWHAGNVVLLGDAAHTAHFSIGSGTKLAMEDAIVLRDELLARGLPDALPAYEARRRPEVESLQAAAQASLEWFEGTERYLDMPAVQLAYSLMTRSSRVSHASVGKRDPELARGVERLLAALAGVTTEPPPLPTALPYTIDAQTRLASRLIVCPSRSTVPDDDQLVALGGAIASGATAVATAALPLAALDHDDAAVGWRRIVDYAHAKHAAMIARVADPTPAVIERAVFAGFDLIVVDGNAEQLPAAVQAAVAHIAGRGGRAPGVGAVVAGGRAGSVGLAAQLVRAGARVVWVTGDAPVLIADRIRNELKVAVCCDGGRALLPDLDAAIAAGRADVIAVEQLPAGFRRT